MRLRAFADAVAAQAKSAGNYPRNTWSGSRGLAPKPIGWTHSFRSASTRARPLDQPADSRENGRIKSTLGKAKNRWRLKPPLRDVLKLGQIAPGCNCHLPPNHYYQFIYTGDMNWPSNIYRGIAKKSCSAATCKGGLSSSTMILTF